ncbi:SPOR domain-containing protein [Endozoicomonas numazuensis]|uniref:SPOR domain-containing protein n=1 Tax=Endozoicomonas numazuensis TaxID=1137799 RepID=UPI00068B4723|nr:SPOR domain-containing protein [Endozoicomonas numazuensis]
MSTRTPSKRGASKAASRKKSGQQSRLPGWMWLITGFAAGFFVAFLFRLTPAPIPVDASLKGAGTVKSDKKEPEPVFDFYTVLPEQEVILPEPVDRQPAKVTAREKSASESEPKTKTATKSGVKYLLQAGSFRSAKDAERLKAQLLLAGQGPRVVKVTVGAGESWHRVQLGPFETSESIDQAKKVLADFKIDGLLLRMK